MGWNDAYWTNKDGRKAKAKEHHEEMLRFYKSEIGRSLDGMTIYSQTAPAPEKTGTPEVIVENMDTVSAILKYSTGDNLTSDNVIALNFASYKNPGGGFLSGSSAQEESLCMESSLYEVLSDSRLAEFYNWNNQHKNKSLYTNRGVLTPGIIFERKREKTSAAVLSVAAPNNKAYMDYINGATAVTNLEALRDRIQFVANIINTQKYDTVVLGAYGCGVFGQDPEVVAGLFKEMMAGSPLRKVVYAVIDKGGHSKEGAYKIFQRVME